MDTQVDWQRELDESFGRGEDVPVARYADRGRRSLRRRRATAVLLTAAVVVAGGAAWAAAPDGDQRSDPPVATQGPSPDQRAVDRVKPSRTERLEQMRDARADEVDFLGNPAALTSDGLVLAPGAGTVLQQEDNPMGYTPRQGTSLAVRVMFRGSERYSLMTRYPDSGTSTSTVAATGDFGGWLASAVRTQHTLDVANGVTDGSPDDLPPPDQWLTLRPDGEVQAGPEVVIVQNRAGIELGGTFADGATRAGAVSLLVRGETVFAAYRVLGGQVEVIEGPGSFDSLDAFVRWARQQYASGTGMR